MGTLIDISSALSVGLPLVVILIGAVLGKFAGGFAGAHLARIGRPILVGSVLVPRGEFSLVLAKTGVDAGLVGPQLYPVAGLAVLVTALASPLIDRATRRLNGGEG
jgi:monovalent cation:H+ antiporter-2, CPA2 family